MLHPRVHGASRANSLAPPWIEIEIEAAEKKLGFKFPRSYRSFLLDFGYASIGHVEVFGLGKDVPEYQNIVHMSLSEWREFKPEYYIPESFIPFYAVGNGDYHCFDTSRSIGEEYPIIWWAHEDFPEYQRNLEIIDTINKDFIEWLNKVIDNYIEEQK